MSRSMITMSIPFRQDMPPVGGFEAVRYKRNLPLRGPSGLAILGGVTALCAYGFYRVGKGNIEKRELQREKIWSRIHLVPLLLAEGDRDAYRREQAALAREKEIMKEVKDWEVGKSVYNNPRYRSSEYIVVL
ncbi:B16.6 subunit of GRIM-19, NADH:ubiquinone oxidoreductase [Multifurca ochricompacta]|uniref:NADH dehydrogenase [ubiquinone] 1 alpha subcomplex subunit 13 n=1 Tax=Multifurca ochricompacta TaxID=376703 RepID=A0AAD4MBX1_9AGAM|nr:B16.6 subunit of GRIM-19, NADH:ubiquinone oxidoreductase [Multifurca ochricompacta]